MCYACGECDELELADDGLEEYRGLGLVPLVGAAVASPTGQSLLKNVGGAIVGGVTDLFGGRPDWFADAASGELRPCSNSIAPPSNEVPDSMRYITRIDPAELYNALLVAPPGVRGQLGPGGTNDPTKGTVEGLRTALLYGHKELAPYLTSLEALANAGAYVAHGTYNCDAPNWSNNAAASHAVYLIRNYRSRERAISSPFPTGGPSSSVPGSPLSAPSSTPATLPELGEVARSNPLATVGIIAGIAFLASLAVHGK